MYKEHFMFSGEKEQLVRKKRKNFETWQYRSNLKSHSKNDKRKKEKRYFKNQFEMEHFLVSYIELLVKHKTHHH